MRVPRQKVKERYGMLNVSYAFAGVVGIIVAAVGSSTAI
jgi:hypothetical protein